MDQIIPGLWIGDLACALATDYLSIAGITHIVSAMKQRLPTPIVLPDGRTIDADHVFHVNIDDVEGAPLLVHMPGTVEFIDEALKQEWLEDEETASEHGGEQQDSGEQTKPTPPPPGKGPGQWATMGEGTVLVHCHAGISRSVALVAAYLMNTRKITRDDAIALIQSRRRQADPNPGFRHQLELYESGYYSVDVRNQRIRRFLMSQFSILRGDPIDDVMLSYFPSPLHSPSNSSSSAGGTYGGLGGSLQISAIDDSQGSRSSSATQSPRSRRGSIPSNGNALPESLTMSRQNSRRAVSIAAAKGGLERHERRRSRSEGMMDFSALRSMSKISSGTSASTAEALVDLSKSPPMPDQSIELFDADDTPSSSERDGLTQALIQRSFSSVKEPHEVMITVSSGNLPGGVKSVRGNQAQDAARSLKSGQRLPKPHFVGTKLRCRMCRRELAAQDHVVEHEPGKGKDAFDVRKREKDVDQKSRDGRAAMGRDSDGSRDDSREMSKEQLFGATSRNKGSETRTEDATIAKPPAASNSAYKSAASLSAQLPPHLAALRLGRNTNQSASARGSGDQTGDRSSANESDKTTRSVSVSGNAARGASDGLRKLLHSSLCSSYFVEPLAWMAALQLGEVAGRLDCPNARCAAKLGSWDWAGMQCAW